MILGGATIGSGCIVAAGALVLPAEYPANVLLAGAPATIKKRLPEEDEGKTAGGLDKVALWNNLNQA